MSKQETDVLIVGGGPVGLTLACLLKQLDVPHRLIEKESERHRESRATDIQSRTLEVLDAMGALEPFLADGVRVRVNNLFAEGGRVGRMVFDRVDSPFPFTLHHDQSRTEKLLETKLNALGGEVERGLSFEEFRQDANRVTAAVLNKGERTELRCRWLVGADGASSTVRHGLAMKLEGSTFEQAFFLADCKLDWELTFEERHIFASKAGLLVVMPLPERRVRIFGDVDIHQDHFGEQELRRYLNERTQREYAIRDLEWTATYKVHTRAASHYRSGRVFLLGDAAHIHSPVGGQGMNIGMQDAYNFAWKLALVNKGWAGSELLDTYEEERRPVAESVLKETKLDTTLGLWHSEWGPKVFLRIIDIASSFPSVSKRIAAAALELSVNYPKSSIVKEDSPSWIAERLHNLKRQESFTPSDWRRFHAGPFPGDRAPDVVLSDGRRLFETFELGKHTLLLLPGGPPSRAGILELAKVARNVDATWGNLIHTFVVRSSSGLDDAWDTCPNVLADGDIALHARYGAQGECLYLIRPDGYIGYRAQPVDAEALNRYLTGTLKLQSEIRASLRIQ